MPKPAATKPADKTTKKEKGNNKSEPVGTKPAVKPSESATAKAEVPKKEDKKQVKKEEKKEATKEDEKEVSKEDKKEDKIYSRPTRTAQSRHVPTMRDRLADYLSTNKTIVDRP